MPLLYMGTMHVSNDNKYLLVSCQVFRCTLPRVGLHLDDYPQIKRIYNNCLNLPQVQKAMPQQQPDAPDASFYTSVDG